MPNVPQGAERSHPFPLISITYGFLICCHGGDLNRSFRLAPQRFQSAAQLSRGGIPLRRFFCEAPLYDSLEARWERYFPVQPRVLRLVNHTHPAFAQLADDAVVRNGPPDHGVRLISVAVESPICILRCGSNCGEFWSINTKKRQTLELAGSRTPSSSQDHCKAPASEQALTSPGNR